MNSKIEWTDETWETLGGCSKTSPGCDSCYAIRVAHRLGANPTVRGLDGLTVVTDDGLDWSGEVRELRHNLDQPLRWRKPRRVFVNSRADTFHPDVEEPYIGRMFDIMEASPAHTFQVLTKRSKRMRDLWPFQDVQRPWPDAASVFAIPPLPNVWLGVSIESQRYVFRKEHLQETPAAVRFLSVEPLLGPVDLGDLTGIDWVIVGGESGPGARPMHPNWARSIRDQCLEGKPCEECSGCGFGVFVGRAYDVPCRYCAGSGRVPVPFFFKQWGNWRRLHREAWGPIEDRLAEVPWTGAVRSPVDHWRGPGKVGCATMVRERSKNFPGHDVLDGEQWHQYPEAQR